MVPLCVLSLLCPSLVVDQARCDSSSSGAEQVKMGTGLGCGSRTLEELSSFCARKVSANFLRTSTITIARR